MNNVVIVSAVRSAIGRFNGSLSEVSTVELGGTIIKAGIQTAGLGSKDIHEVILGNVIQAGAGPNIARQALVRAGLPVEVPAYTVNKVCASGMKSITLAALSIASGEQDIVIAGGVESMSCTPFILGKARMGYRLGDGKLLDSILSDALVDPVAGYHMGITAENLADEFSISRDEQDNFALLSHQKAINAIKNGNFLSEIVGVPVRKGKGDLATFQIDEHPRTDTSLDALASLKPVFKKGGSVTAGNSSGINDGAAIVVLMSEDSAKRIGLRPMARVVAFASTALDPHRMGMGPVAASRLALEKAGMSIADVELVELNEAFAAQSIAVIRELDLDPNKVNPNGGAIALGHPVGASGARIVVTLVHEMVRLQKPVGLATLCVGGGQGMSIVLETI